jgi:hypothetical protein
MLFKMRGAPYSTQDMQKAMRLSNTPEQQACLLTDHQDTFIGESLQSLFDGNDAGDHAEGHGIHKYMVGGDAIADKSGEHEDHDEGHEDQLPPLRRRVILISKEAHASSKKVHSAGLR